MSDRTKNFTLQANIKDSQTEIDGTDTYATITFFRYSQEPIKVGFETLPQSTDQLLQLKHILDTYLEARNKFLPIKDL